MSGKHKFCASPPPLTHSPTPSGFTCNWSYHDVIPPIVQTLHDRWVHRTMRTIRQGNADNIDRRVGITKRHHNDTQKRLKFTHRFAQPVHMMQRFRVQRCAASARRRTLPRSLLFVFAEFLKTRIIPERIEHRIEPEQRWSERYVSSQTHIRYREYFL